MHTEPYFKNSSERIVALVIACAMFMEALDTTIINTAIPAMSQSLHVSPIDLKVALISYLISLAIFIPISGWVADKFGAKQVFISSLVIFTISSIWCGFSQTIVELVISRIVQGVGGSIMMPVGRLIILRTFARKRLIVAMNKVVTIGMLGAMLGPVLGGLIVGHFSWHWIFWVNIPFGILTISAAIYYFEPTPPRAVHKLDIIGFLLFGSGLAGLTFGLSALSETELPQIDSFVIVFMAVVSLLSYIVYAKKAKNPVIQVGLFGYPTFKISMLGNVFARLGFGGVPFLLPLLLQICLGYSSQMSGVLIAPIALGVVLSKQFSMPLLRYLGFRKLLILNTLLVGLSLWSCVLINQHTSIYIIAMITFVFGCLLSLQFSAMNALAYTEIPESHLSGASSAMSTMQQLTQSFGVAVSAILLRYLASKVSAIKYGLTMSVFHTTFLILGFITLISVVIFMKLKSDDGNQMLK